MALADKLMEDKGTKTKIEEPSEDGTFAELRKRFLEGSDSEAYDAFMGMIALCEEGGEEPEENTKPGLHIRIMGGK